MYLKCFVGSMLILTIVCGVSFLATLVEFKMKKWKMPSSLYLWKLFWKLLLAFWTMSGIICWVFSIFNIT